ncbi:hypothetical protein GH714_038142 [Hevea brasiliensis]|uniref:Uncharacterized protein n=1 Tax=Hevea brasiliensis TaxID=3981 RepID=A0A6A6KGR6_HEVBR|nr:hypothetical protein GH714_038142 [Hevea brasiliensis]
MLKLSSLCVLLEGHMAKKMRITINANIITPNSDVELEFDIEALPGTTIAGGLEEQSLSSGFPQSPSFSANEEALNVEKLGGISPSSLLCERSREVSSSLGCFNGGIGPENWFPSRCNSLRCGSSITDPGIGPENELLAKLMVLRPGSCCNASISIVPERLKSER